ncbi:hypothetical protein [Arthrobacter sp. Soil736]|uniref:hypothetical protein n=1 Tax=Arthrobacter sp. Soil736 TaxID=1736395 RepID=UPI000A9EB8C7|nr:hypothetical protein [Arthrobacter sp. Soil736]
MAAKDELSPSARELLKKVKQHYMKSGDFNELHVNTSWNSRDDIEAAAELADAGLIEVVGPGDYRRSSEGCR